MTVYAQWGEKEVFPIYKVTFNKNGGDIDANPQIKYVNSEFERTIDRLPAPPMRGGYNFLGWNTRADGDGDGFDTLYHVTEDMVVYAEWWLIPVIEPPKPPGNEDNITGDIEQLRLLYLLELHEFTEDLRQRLELDYIFKEDHLSDEMKDKLELFYEFDDITIEDEEDWLYLLEEIIDDFFEESLYQMLYIREESVDDLLENEESEKLTPFKYVLIKDETVN